MAFFKACPPAQAPREGASWETDPSGTGLPTPSSTPLQSPPQWQPQTSQSTPRCTISKFASLVPLDPLHPTGVSPEPPRRNSVSPSSPCVTEKAAEGGAGVGGAAAPAGDAPDGAELKSEGAAAADVRLQELAHGEAAKMGQAEQAQGAATIVG